MKDLKKNLIYWGMTFQKLSLSMILGIFAYVLVMVLMEGGFSEEEIKSAVLGYIWMVIPISVFINGFTASNSYFPMTISLGSTRKASFTAMQIMQHLIMVEYLLIGAAAYYFWNREVFDFLVMCVFTVIGVVLIFLALANMTWVISLKFGKAGEAGYVATLLVILAVLVIFFIISANTEDERYMGVFLDSVRSFVQKPYLFVIGIIADAVSIGMYFHAMKKKDLQF